MTSLISTKLQTAIAKPLVPSEPATGKLSMRQAHDSLELRFSGDSKKKPRTRLAGLLLALFIPLSALVSACAPSAAKQLDEQCQTIMSETQSDNCDTLIEQMKTDQDTGKRAWAIRQVIRQDISYQQKIPEVIRALHDPDGDVIGAGYDLGNSLIQDTAIPAETRQLLQTYLDARPYSTRDPVYSYGYRYCPNGKFDFCYGLDHYETNHHGDAELFQQTEQQLTEIAGRSR